MSIIKDLRKKMGLSQKELADKLFVNQTAVSQWERGVTTPNKNTLIKLADIFGVTVDFLLGVKEDEDKDVAAILQELKDRPELKTLFSASADATREDIIRAARFLDFLKDGSNQE